MNKKLQLALEEDSDFIHWLNVYLHENAGWQSEKRREFFHNLFIVIASKFHACRYGNYVRRQRALIVKQRKAIRLLLGSPEEVTHDDRIDAEKLLYENAEP